MTRCKIFNPKKIKFHNEKIFKTCYYGLCYGHDDKLRKQKQVQV